MTQVADAISNTHAIARPSVFSFLGNKTKSGKKLSEEDMEVVMALEAVQSDMEFLHKCFDNTTDPILVDSLIYEIKATQLKHQYYINQCKEKGIVYGRMERE